VSRRWARGQGGSGLNGLRRSASVRGQRD
jgi:hypothetical protein